MKSMIRLMAMFMIVVSLVACQKAVPHDPNKIRVGTIAGPESALLDKAAEILKRDQGIVVEVVQFEDYVTPNVALSDGVIDANMFQHQPYLDLIKASRGLDIVPVARTFVYPMGVYSKKYTNISEVPDHAKVGVPNDPSNETRALLLLEHAGMIVIDQSSYHPDIHDLSENSKQLQFSALDAAQLPRALADLDIAVINTNFAIPAGFKPSQALLIEPPSSPYANLLVAREENKNDPAILALIEVLHSDEVLDVAKSIFGEYAIPAWQVQPQIQK